MLERQERRSLVLERRSLVLERQERRSLVLERRSLVLERQERRSLVLERRSLVLERWILSVRTTGTSPIQLVVRTPGYDDP